MFRELFDIILLVLEHLAADSDGETSALAAAYHKSIASDIEFLTALFVVSRVFSLTKPYAELLQSPTCDLVKCYDNIESMAVYLAELLDDGSMNTLHNELVQFAAAYEIPYQLSRRKKTTVREFFDVMYRTFISNTLDELGSRFSTHQKLAANISKLMPNNVTTAEFTDLKETFEFYKDDLRSDSFLVLESEFELWRNSWRKRMNENLPLTVDHLLKEMRGHRDFYPNVYQLLTLFATLPVSVATAERSFSTLKLVKTFLRNTMGDDRLSALALLHIHKDVTRMTNAEEVVDEFGKRNRRIKLTEQ